MYWALRGGDIGELSFIYTIYGRFLGGRAIETYLAERVKE